ncbi:MAG: mandelate racemase/muconate lactonizing enzyme family protein [Actinomycetota bacterium]|nr:mandelate racemase/muconate lactonizing enzyme family protein [Actinomycetota bacterium]
MEASDVASGERIADVRSYICQVTPHRSLHVVVVETASGHIGVGECSQSDQDLAVQQNLRVLTEKVRGYSVFDLCERLTPWLASGRSGRAWAVAVSGVEMAVWDLQAKIVGRPAFQLWGGSCRERVRCYATVAVGVDTTSQDEVFAECARLINDGFRAVKIVPFSGLSRAKLLDRETRLGIGRGIELLRALRSSYPELDIAVESNFAFSERVASLVLHEVAEFELLWVEAPLWWDDEQALSRLRSISEVPIASGELGHGKTAYRALIEANAIDVIQPDVKWCGGCSEFRKIAAWSEVHQISVAPHNNSGPIATAVSAHLAMHLSNCALLEVSSRMPTWANELGIGAEMVEHGSISRDRLCSTAGFGVSVREEVLRGLLDSPRESSPSLMN